MSVALPSVESGPNDNRPRIFSPRMDYDEWTPLGRGDPLKNNPTFDYVPPVLDRVQYWLDSHTTEPSSKRDILVLGVTAKKTSPKIPEQFLKFVDGPKFARPVQMDVSYRNDFTGSSGAEPPKVMRTTNFRTNGLVDYRNQNRLPASYYPTSYYGQKLKPYTMMMPPRMVQKAETSTNYNLGAASKDRLVGYADASQPYSTQTEEGPSIFQDAQYYAAPSKDYGHYSPAPSSRPYATSRPASNKGAPSQVETIKSVYAPTGSQYNGTRSRYETTTSPSVSFEKSNLIYQSTQTLSGGWLGNNGPTSSSSSSTGFSDPNQTPTWQTLDYSRDRYEVDRHVAAASSNHEVIVEQNANVVASSENVAGATVGQRESASTEPSASSSTTESVAQTLPVSTTTVDSLEQEEDEEDEDEEQRETDVTDAQSSPKMHIVLANSSAGVASPETQQTKKGPVAVVMPTNYFDRNASSSSSSSSSTFFSSSSSSSPPPEPPTTVEGDAWENDPTTPEMTKTAHRQTPKPQQAPTRGPAISSSIPTEGPSVTVAPGRIMPSSQLPVHQSSSSMTMPTRHASGLLLAFFPPQGVAQSTTRPPSRPYHSGMQQHPIGGMHPPNFRPSSPMSHMSPPMAHMHPPPAPSAEQKHQLPPFQPFPVQTFTGPPPPPPPPSSTAYAQITNEQPSMTIDHRPPSRPLSATTVEHSMTASSSSSSSSGPFAPTISPTVEYTSTEADGRTSSARPDQPSLAKILSAEESLLAPSSTFPPRATTVPGLAADPTFSRYKQPPAKPTRGPMYLIIQGHSKVKTYKPTINKHGVPVENNEIAESATERQLSKLEQLIMENTKNGAVAAVAGIDAAAEKRKLQERARAEKLASARHQDSLMSLVESGLEGFTASPSAGVAVTTDERRANSVASVDID